MSNPPTPPVGRVMSADIAVPEHARCVRFYARILTTGEQPLWREDLMNNRGTPIIGLGERTPAYAELPLQWMPHIQVADVAASVGRALALDATVLLQDDDDAWAVLCDPAGAAFGLIPIVADAALPEEGLLPEGVGHIAGLSLTVPDAPALREFYRQVIGWSQPKLAGDDDQPGARVRPADGTAPGLPAVWLIELPVGDLVESLRRVRQDGGEVLEEAVRADGSTVWAVVKDPVGSCLVLTAT